jgi:hypothetical protein
MFYPNESNLVTFGTFWRLNESWQVSEQIGVEGANGTIQEQRYSIYRDLTAWNVALNMIVRENDAVKDEFAVYVSMTLKAFPEQAIGFTY